ncbi:MAG TPA: hypothetical protein VN181_00045, partial [Thermoanaerobaculia bacterium]|nr:hypothetical protein [Thermoanaerobaculia bacterium]
MRRTRLVLLTVLLATVTLPLAAQKHPNIELGFNAEKLYQFTGLDSVNLFNGNLVVTIPIGRRYPVNDEFSYGLTLVYNSKVWDYEKIVVVQQGSGDDYYVGDPSRRSNAGLGWRLSLGRLLSPSAAATRYPFTDRPYWVYESPAGDEHAFDTFDPAGNNALVKVENGTSYLRMVKVTESLRKVEFPNGEVHEFTNMGTRWRLTKMRDRLGNEMTVSYTRDSSDRDLKWTLVDSQNRTHTVTFVNSSAMASSIDRGQMVSSISLAGIHQSATYQFN